MSTITVAPLRKMNEIVTALMAAQPFTASLGTAADEDVWALAAAHILNGNTLLTLPDVSGGKIIVKASSMVMDVGLAGFQELALSADLDVSVAAVPPGGARNYAGNYFFSQHDPWHETVVVLSGYHNHIYISWDSVAPSHVAIGCIANHSAEEPSQSMAKTYLAAEEVVSPRQALCIVNSSNKVVAMRTFPAMVQQLGAVVQDAAPLIIRWDTEVCAIPNNAMQVNFTFPPGTATGAIGEIAIKTDNIIIAHVPITPQLMKDGDIEFALRWNLMVGEPGVFF